MASVSRHGESYRYPGPVAALQGVTLQGELALWVDGRVAERVRGSLLFAHFGVSDEALLDVITGTYAPTGKLPFELPSSMDAVRASLQATPNLFVTAVDAVRREDGWMLLFVTYGMGIP